MGTERSRITVGASWSRLDGDDTVIAAVDTALSAVDPGAKHTYKVKAGKWDGVERFFNRPSRTFPAGLTRRAARALVAAGLPRPDIDWGPATPGVPLTAGLLDFTWRTYQTVAVDYAVNARRVALQCPTRGGKTEIAIEYARRVGRKTLWITHLRELLRQTPERFKLRLGLDVGIVAGMVNTDGPVVVGMLQTLRRRLALHREYFRQFGCVVFDEGHHAGSETAQDVLRACVNADYRLAMSGTMVTGNPVTDLRIEGAFGPLYTVSSTAELADLGFVARPRVVMLAIPPSTYPSYEEVRETVCPTWRRDPRQLVKLGGALFRETYRRGVVENDARNRAVVDVAVRHASTGERFLVLCTSVAHAESLADAIGRRLPRASRVYLLNGASTDDERAVTLTEFKRATSGAVLVCTPFFREGVDVPQIDAGFLAGGGESSIAVWQAFSRMLTARPGKSEVLVYDCLDGRDRRRAKDYLARHAWESRLPLYESHGFEVERIEIP